MNSNPFLKKLNKSLIKTEQTPNLNRSHSILTFRPSDKEVRKLLYLVKEADDVVQSATEQLQLAEHVLLTEPELAPLAGLLL